MGERKLYNIEALRGLASLAVAWFHLTNSHLVPWVRESGAYGWLGVDVFFVISGFVIPYSLNASNYTLAQFPRFMARRLIRLEPPYIASIILIIALAYATPLVPAFHGAAPHYTVVQVASHLLYMVPLFHQEWINIVYWTLAFEFVFYLGCGLLFPVLFKKGLWLTALIALAAAFLLTGKHAFVDHRVMLFLTGIAAMRYFTGRDGLAIFLVCLAANCGVMIAAGAIAPAIAGTATGLILALVRMPNIRILTWLGSLSYSLYLIHVPIGSKIINLAHRFGHGAAFELALSLFALAACLAFAWVFNRLFEAPATALARKLSLRPKPSEPAPMAA